jgi:hypothetical protein
VVTRCSRCGSDPGDVGLVATSRILEALTEAVRGAGWFSDSRCPIVGLAGLNLGGYWSTYWYSGGNVYAAEIARGFDSFELLANDQL